MKLSAMRLVLVAAIAVAGGCDNGTTTVDSGSPGGDSGPSDTDSGPGDTDSGPGDTDGGPGDVDGGPGDVDGGPGDVDGGPGDVDGGPVATTVNGCSRATATDLTGMSSTAIAFGGSLTYAPPCIVVSAGTMVTFNGTFSFHPLQAGTVTAGIGTPQTSGTPLPTTALATGTTASFTMAEAGTYPYYCVAHAAAGMMGAIFVE